MPLSDTPKSTLVPTAAFFKAGGYKLWNHFSHFHSSRFSLPPRVLLACCYFSATKFIPVTFLDALRPFCCTFTARRSITVCSSVTVSMRLCFVFFPCVLCYTKSPSLSRSLSADHSITLETCRQAARELHTSLRKTVMLYTTVSKRQCVG